MKRIIKLICFLLAGVISFSLVACSGETASSVVKEDLINVVYNSDLSSGEITASVKGNENFYDFTALLQKTQKGYDLDMYFMTYSLTKSDLEKVKYAGAVFCRDDGLYLADFGKGVYSVEVSTSDYKGEICDLLNSKKATYSYFDNSGEIYTVFASMLKNMFDLPDVTLEQLPLLPTTLFGFLQNRDSLNKGDAVVVYNGYRLSVDLMSNLRKSLNSIVEIGKTIDRDPSLTIEELFFTKEFTDVFKGLLVNTSAEIVKGLLDTVQYKLEESDYKISFPDLTPLEGENGYGYLYRFINSKIEGLTIASLRIKDLMLISGFKSDDSAEALFKKMTDRINDTVREFTDALKVIYFFNTEAELTRISLDFNLKTNNVLPDKLMATETVHVKVDFKLKDISSLLMQIAQ